MTPVNEILMMNKNDVNLHLYFVSIWPYYSFYTPSWYAEVISQLFKQICSNTGPIKVSKQWKFITFIHISHYERIWADISVTMLTNESSAQVNTYAGWR